MTWEIKDDKLNIIIIMLEFKKKIIVQILLVLKIGLFNPIFTLGKLDKPINSLMMFFSYNANMCPIKY